MIPENLMFPGWEKAAEKTMRRWDKLVLQVEVSTEAKVKYLFRHRKDLFAQLLAELYKDHPHRGGPL